MAGTVANLNIGPCWVRWTPDGTFPAYADLTVQGITVTARTAGMAGNSVQLALVDPSGNDQALDVSVAASVITVSLATDGSGDITSTASDVVAALNVDTESKALVFAEGSGSSALSAAAAASLTGGTDGDVAERDLGYTQGGVAVKVSTETKSIEVDQETEPVIETILSRAIEITVPLAEFTMDNLLLAFPGAEIVTDGTDPTKKKLLLKSAAGVDTSTLVGKLRLHPTDKDVLDASEDFTFNRAMPSGEFEFTYDKENVKIVNVTFKPQPDDDGVFGAYGDPEVSA